MPSAGDSELYFRQLAVGPMANFVYLIGDRAVGNCLVVDPAWDVEAIAAAAEADGMTITGSLVTHYHPDHVGGRAMGFAVPGGIAPMLARAPGRIHVNRHEADGVITVTGVSESDLVRHDDRDRIEIGSVVIELLHTPGHTPGSQCFLVRDRLVSGDTLFIDGCGRVDLPGGDPEEMRVTLTRRLAAVADAVTLFPGHDYGAVPSATMGEQRRSNPYLVQSPGNR